MTMRKFKFHTFSPFFDDDLEVRVRDRLPANPAKGFVPVYVFEMRVAGTGEAAGELELRIGNTDLIRNYGGHLGYRVYVPFRGRHFAARACRLVVPVARRHGLTRCGSPATLKTPPHAERANGLAVS